jgi:mono/diheme cytochrome c family protein
MRRVMKRLTAALALAPLMVWCGAATAGDPAAGEAIYDEQCAECHEPDDFSGESAADISVWIVSEKNQTKHKGKADLGALSPDDVENVAVFFSQ